MKLILYLISLISVFTSSNLSKNNDENFQLNINSNLIDSSNKRKLEESEFKPIRIELIYMADFEYFLSKTEEGDHKEKIKGAFNNAVNAIQKIVNVHRLTEKIIITPDANTNTLLRDYLNREYDADLVIFIDGSKDLEDKDFENLKIMKKYNTGFNNGRPIVGHLNFNLRHRNYHLPDSDD